MDTNFLRDLRLACGNFAGAQPFVAEDVLQHLPLGTMIHSVQAGLGTLARRGELDKELRAAPTKSVPNRRIALYRIGKAFHAGNHVPPFIALGRVEAAVRRWHTRAA